MAKRLKLRLSRILSNCCSKDFPSDPLPIPNPPPLLPRAGDCPARKQITFRWRQEKDFHVISISTVRDAKVLPGPSLTRRSRRHRAITSQKVRKHGKVHLAPLLSVGGDSSSSAMSSSDEGGGFDLGAGTRATAEQGTLLMRRRASEVEFEARLSSVERVWRCGGGMRRKTKVRESYAVVKRTEDPYGEFRRSMMEMVTEKEIYKEDELRELLRCLISLNGREHHGIILRAFAEVRDALFRKKITFDDYYYYP